MGAPISFEWPRDIAAKLTPSERREIEILIDQAVARGVRRGYDGRKRGMVPVGDPHYPQEMAIRRISALAGEITTLLGAQPGLRTHEVSAALKKGKDRKGVSEVSIRVMLMRMKRDGTVINIRRPISDARGRGGSWYLPPDPIGGAERLVGLGIEKELEREYSVADLALAVPAAGRNVLIDLAAAGEVRMIVRSPGHLKGGIYIVGGARAPSIWTRKGGELKPQRRVRPHIIENLWNRGLIEGEVPADIMSTLMVMRITHRGSEVAAHLFENRAKGQRARATRLARQTAEQGEDDGVERG